MDKGAHFYKTDFQIHSPRDAKWSGCKPTSDEDRLEYARKFITQCREKGIEAVGITDHHDVCFVKYFQLAAQENGGTRTSLVDLVLDPSKQDPIVFPGIEVTLSQPCQAIILLDADADPSIHAQLLQAIGIGNLHPDKAATGIEPSPISLDLLELDEKIKEYASGCLKGKFIILPHVSDGGHKTLLRDGFHTHFANMPCVGGYVEHDWADHTGKSKLDGTHPQYGHKAIGIFQTSDSRREDRKELGCRNTWVKMAVPTAEALRQACLARESRLAQTQPELPSRYISRIEVSGSVFMGKLAFDLNPQFNALIGGRGTGKSTILEYLRWGMQDQPSEYDSDLKASDGADRKRQLIRDTLTKTGESVTVHWVLDGIPHVVRHDSGTSELTVQVDTGEPTPMTAEQVREILPIRAYSQKQLSSVSDRTEELQRFIKHPIRDQLSGFQRRILERRREIKDTYETILGRRQIERELALSQTNLASLAGRAGAVEEDLPELGDDAQKAIREQPKRLREEQAVEAVRKDMSEAAAAVGEAVRKLSLLPRELSLQEASPQALLITALYDDARAAITQATADMKKIGAALAGKDAEVVATKKKWQTGHEVHSRAFVAAQQETVTHKKQMGQLAELRAQEAAAQKRVNELTRELSGIQDGEEAFSAQLASWIELHRERGDALQEQCDNLSALSDGDIRAELARGADLARALQALKDALGGSRITNDRWETLKSFLLAEDLAVQKWQSLMLELRALAELDPEDIASGTFPPPLACWELTDNQRLTIVGKLTPQKWLEIVTMSLEDMPQFFFNTSLGEIPFEQASAGQQATSLLKALLHEGGGPLVIDQPEEDLDNAVIPEIAELIWEAKKNHQIVFVSHNANLVVNGDAELIVHCDYVSEDNRSKGAVKHLGAIDVDAVRDVITRVMEGGERAFTLRKDKYDF